MLLLPPPVSVGRVERRSRERRAAERRAAAETSSAFDQAAGPDEPQSGEPETVAAPAFRSRAGNRGRRKTDREAPGADFGYRDGPVPLAKPHAPLVAQLIATALDVEQTRVRRRGSMDDATALYRRKAERAKPSRGEA